jgi:hypothetical protein
MQSVAVFIALVAAASASTVFRVPSADSAVISSQRVGGNFAYSTQESQAFGVVNPVVSHVTSPVATTYSVQQPASVWTGVSTGTPAATTYTTGAVQQTVGYPLTQQVAAAYGSYPYGFSYGNIVAPTTYAAIQSNVVGVDAQTEVNKVQQVQQIQQVQPQAVTYAVEQPQAVTYAVQQPQTATYTVQQPQTVATYAVQPQTATYTVQQPQAAAYTVHNQHQGSIVATGSPVATTYAVQHPISVVSSGTPASTYNTVAGASPLGFNAWNYGLGGVAQPWGYNVVV